MGRKGDGEMGMNISELVSNYMRKTADCAQLTRHLTMELDKGACRRLQKADHHFLTCFVMGVYFGPDLRGQEPLKSALQRINEELPLYTSDQLAGSYMSIEELEQLYCFILRKSDKSVEIDLSVLREFLQGKCSNQDEEESNTYLQFSDLFPAHLHQFLFSADRSIIIENIVYIDNPETFYLKPDDIERFRRLTGQENFCFAQCTIKLKNRLLGRDNTDIQDELQNSSKDIRYYRRKRRLDDNQCENEEAFSLIPAGKDVLSNGTNNTQRRALTPSGENSKPEPMEGPAVVVLPSQPSAEELDSIVAKSRYGYALRGSAVKGQLGPVIGLMDIGEAEDSYLFRVALPGVKKEGRTFRCEVESDGKVLIKGETVTGESTVYRYTQAFEMQTHNLCPPGPFSISFRLPGPVDHRQFNGSFGADGILEGIVKKA
ncbi:hypothetical protein V2J09_007893 [Rumex salicifolius]